MATLINDVIATWHSGAARKVRKALSSRHLATSAALRDGGVQAEGRGGAGEEEGADVPPLQPRPALGRGLPAGRPADTEVSVVDHVTPADGQLELAEVHRC